MFRGCSLQSHSTTESGELLRLNLELTFTLLSSQKEQAIRISHDKFQDVWRLLHGQLSSANNSSPSKVPIPAILPTLSQDTSNSNPRQATGSQNDSEGQKPRKRSIPTWDHDQPASKRPRIDSNGNLKDGCEPQEDCELASQIVSGILEGVDSIRRKRIPSSCSALTRFRPKGNLAGLAGAWEQYVRDAELCVESQKQSAESCVEAGSYKERMVSLIKCFLEIAQAHTHKRSRISDRVRAHAESKDERQQRRRVGELVVWIWNGVYQKYGKKALGLCAILAATKPERFDPNARSWKTLTKERVRTLAEQITSRLPETTSWLEVDSDFALDPAEVVTASDFAYMEAQTALKLNINRPTSVPNAESNSGFTVDEVEVARLEVADGECEHLISGDLDAFVNGDFEDLCDAEFDHFMSGSFDFGILNPEYSQAVNFQACALSNSAFTKSHAQCAAGDISNMQIITGMPLHIPASGLLSRTNSADGIY